MTNKKKFLIFIFYFVTNFYFSQLSINSGFGTINGFGVKKTFYGVNLGLEYPRSNQTTFFGRFAYYIPRNNNDSTSASASAISLTTFPYNLQRNYIASTGYFTVEGGTRYYLLNGYDNGFSVYGGSTIMACINSVKKKYEVWKYPYDENDYENYGEQKGTILNFGVGIQGGLKYTFPNIGTIFCDLSGTYLIMRQASNDVVYESENYPFNSAILFSFNIGFRKDFY
jgi:hypothetical protein